MNAVGARVSKCGSIRGVGLDGPLVAMTPTKEVPRMAPEWNLTRHIFLYHRVIEAGRHFHGRARDERSGTATKLEGHEEDDLAAAFALLFLATSSPQNATTLAVWNFPPGGSMS
jgi:hypothetical protein